MKLLYYPGCTLRSSAVGFDVSAKQSAAALGIELVELQDITCCGGLFPQTTENLMPLLAPTRVLVQAQRQNIDGQLMTLCSFCYNTLKRTNHFLKVDAQKRSILSDFLEEPYRGELEIVHFLEVLKNTIGYESIQKKVHNGSIAGMKVAAYYGCLLLRPSEELGLDDPEQPTILEDLLRALGCEVVDFPMRTECCGSFLIISDPSAAKTCSMRILSRVENSGIETLVTSCPLCQYNLTKFSGLDKNHDNGKRISILYFTQILGLALGIEPEKLGISSESSKAVTV